MCLDDDSDTPRQQQMVEFADEEEELLRDHEQSLRQLEVLVTTVWRLFEFFTFAKVTTEFLEIDPDISVLKNKLFVCMDICSMQE